MCFCTAVYILPAHHGDIPTLLAQEITAVPNRIGSSHFRQEQYVLVSMFTAFGDVSLINL